MATITTLATGGASAGRTAAAVPYLVERYIDFAAAFQPVVVGATADTIDLLIQAATTAPTSGVVRVWAVLMNVDGRIVADEVDRDLLA